MNNPLLIAKPEQYLAIDGARRAIEPLLSQISDILPDHYVVTLVARSKKIANAQIVLTNDGDVTEIVKALQGAIYEPQPPKPQDQSPLETKKGE